MELIFIDVIQIYFELAWALLSQRRYLEASDAFNKVKKSNSWYVFFISNVLPLLLSVASSTLLRSHGTYAFLIAGCLLAAGETQRAQELFDKIPAALERKKKAKRELPLEIYVKRKR
jgi:tetratricopeptide (TPR) repeat protein